MMDFSRIDTWVFDLDNTLYNANAHVFVVMGQLMRDFVSERLGITPEEAISTRNRLWHKYGSTLRGLMDEYGVPPHEFLDHTHAIDLSPVPKDAVLVERLARLPGRKFIFSNTARSFGARMVEHLGLGPHFDGVFVIEDSGFRPKPDARAFDSFFKKHDVDPSTACMFEDTLPNLEAARGFGMATVWIYGHQDDVAGDIASLPCVDDRAETLSLWLEKREKT
jgi:putative hydrolase of the HAD superfamily